MNQQEYLGFGSIKNLSYILDKEKPERIFLVTGRKSYETCGAKSALESLLSQYQITRFSDFSSSPKIQDIRKGIGLLKQNDYDLIIAIGGGSVIDIAKSINILQANPANPLEYIKKQKSIERKGKSLIAIPTTSGSGSEATQFAVIYVDKIKHSLDHKDILPNYSILDPNFTLALPRKITASTGMDALSQAIESYWCINSTEESKNYSSEAIKLIINNLVSAFENPSLESREAMMKAAHLAGKAINITKTTAPHAISYPITSHFGVSHGHAVALTLPSMLLYNSKVTDEDVLDKRGANYVRKTIKEIVYLLRAKNEEDVKNKLTNLMKNIGLETRLSKLGISNIEHMLTSVSKERLKNNPRELSRENLRHILENIF